MAKAFLKRMVLLAVIAVLSLPASFVHAANPVHEVIDNMADATSVDFSADLDIETDNDQLTQPVKIHADLDGVSDMNQNSSFDLHISSSGEDGKAHEFGGSMIMISDTLYLSEDGDEWYFVTRDQSSELPEVEDVADSTDEMKDVLDDLFDRGVIDYHLETVDFIHKKSAVRYGYTIDTDRLVDYLVEKHEMTDAQSDELRASFVENVTISGNVWIDTSAMLPVMFTLNVNVDPAGASYTRVGFSVLFNSFNDSAKIAAPKNAVSIEEYTMSDSGEVVMSSIASSMSMMDTDGDGLSDSDEDDVWHTNPLSADTDGDGYADYTEVINGYNPNGTGKLDSDKDGLSDYAEMTVHWTNRFDSDSDNDGYSDGVEIANGYNPNGLGRW